MIDTIDECWMRRVVELATQAAERGEAAVGSLVLSPEGGVLAEAQECVNRDNDPTAHAEALAIRIACHTLGHRDLSGCTMYTTVEPCFLCAYLIRVTGIIRVVIDKPVAGIGGATSCFPLLTTTLVPDFSLAPEVVWWNEDSAAT